MYSQRRGTIREHSRDTPSFAKGMLSSVDGMSVASGSVHSPFSTQTRSALGATHPADAASEAADTVGRSAASTGSRRAGLHLSSSLGGAWTHLGDGEDSVDSDAV